MNVQDPVGTVVTSDVMSNGTIGVHDGWTVDPNAFTVGAHQIDRAGAVTVDGVVYPTSHPSKSLALDHASNFSLVHVFIPPGHRAVTVAGYITFGVPQVDSSVSQLFDYVGILGEVTGGFAVLQLNNGADGVYALNLEASEGGTHHSANIVITPGATYWCVLKADFVGGTAYLNVYDATQRTLVGAVTTAMTTGEDAIMISMGNGEIGTASGATSYFENMVIDYTQGVFPLGPTGDPASTVTPRDINGDGRADVIWRQTATGDVGATLMTGAPVATAPTEIAPRVPLTWQIAGLGDLRSTPRRRRRVVDEWRGG
ncbi:MAG: hypothetical protein DMF90_24850 [Acidobacteria bacterium]|nr:MAG: hypothetical protein DMF90_24850 [Acidobacteriota bacterium]